MHNQTIYWDSSTQVCLSASQDSNKKKCKKILNTSFLSNIPFKVPVCVPEQLQCVKQDIKLSSMCIKSCEGLMITGYSKLEFDHYSQNNIQNTLRAYKDYKKWFKFPTGIKGITLCGILRFSLWWCISDYEWKNNLRYVRIYFDTSTFDRITKDRAAKFEDMLSTIGGTMGLLTGFSIISGVEILYFAGKIILNKLKK